MEYPLYPISVTGAGRARAFPSSTPVHPYRPAVRRQGPSALSGRARGVPGPGRLRAARTASLLRPDHRECSDLIVTTTRSNAKALAGGHRWQAMDLSLVDRSIAGGNKSVDPSITLFTLWDDDDATHPLPLLLLCCYISTSHPLPLLLLCCYIYRPCVRAYGQLAICDVEEHPGRTSKR